MSALRRRHLGHLVGFNIFIIYDTVCFQMLVTFWDNFVDKMSAYALYFWYGEKCIFIYIYISSKKSSKNVTNIWKHTVIFWKKNVKKIENSNVKKRNWTVWRTLNGKWYPFSGK